MRTRIPFCSLGLGLVLAAGCSAHDPPVELDTGTAQQAAMGNQDKMDAFYDWNNQITVTIWMRTDPWTNMSRAMPKNDSTNPASTGLCNPPVGEPPVGDVWGYHSTVQNGYDASRYDWFDTYSVNVKTSVFPKQNDSFTYPGVVRIKKKGFCGSYATGLEPILSNKPAFSIESPDEAAAEALIGTKHLTFNNLKNDPDSIRQCLGYKLLDMAHLPSSRCNFAHVIMKVGQAGTIKDLGLYANVEPIKKKYLNNNFDGNGGNLYELEGEDLESKWLERIEHDSSGLYEAKKDLYDHKEDLVTAMNRVSAAYNAQTGAFNWGTLETVIDVDQMIRLWAMEIMLKHWDGYVFDVNNTFLYNEVPAVANPNPDSGQIRFNFIPWGIDSIFTPVNTWEITRYHQSLLTDRMYADPSGVYKDKLRWALYSELADIFNAKILETERFADIQTLINAANAVVPGSVPSGVYDTLVNELKGVRPGIDRLRADAGDSSWPYTVTVPTAKVRIMGPNNQCLHRTKTSVGTDSWAIDTQTCGTSQEFWFRFAESSGKPGHYKIWYKESGADFNFWTRADASHSLYYGKSGPNTDYSQYFTLYPRGNGVYQLQSVETGGCLVFRGTSAPYINAPCRLEDEEMKVQFVP